MTVPRIFSSKYNQQHELVKQWMTKSTTKISSSSSQSSQSWWSPKSILQEFEASILAVKCSKQNNRFFMYEETEGFKLQDDHGPTKVIEMSPMEFANCLEQQQQQATTPNDNDFNESSSSLYHYYYWTSPIMTVAPNLLYDRFENFHLLYNNNDNDEHQQQQQQQYLDPRGPSLWMGSSGSGTQAHYDVADNILVQLYGTKRIRMYPPSAATRLHVFPDAHPRARKSQVNLDHYLDNDKNDNNHSKFPLYFDNHNNNIPKPILDVVLQPGDSIYIPAFWFHHIENGKLPTTTTTNTLQPNNITSTNIIDGPSVSLNMFSLSRPMLIAQDIFRSASRSVILERQQRRPQQQQQASPPSSSLVVIVAILQSLGFGLLEQLQIMSPPQTVIQTSLLTSRYAPLKYNQQQQNSNNIPENSFLKAIQEYQNQHNQEQQQNQDATTATSSIDVNITNTNDNVLTRVQKEQIENCLKRILPMFELLIRECSHNNNNNNNNHENQNHPFLEYNSNGFDSKHDFLTNHNNHNDNGIPLLVACHLLELWAVEFVGPSKVADVWEAVLQFK